MVEPDEKLAAVRRALPVTERVAFLNAGSHGPLTAGGAEAIARAANEEVREGRLGALQFQRGGQLKNATRGQFARLLGCDPSEVGITTSTTAGMDIACWGLNWAPGDEIITTDVEHQGGLSPLYILQHRFGVRLRFAEAGSGGQSLISSIEAAWSERTRAIVLSHVSWSTGIVLPLREVAELAHKSGALVFADGAQSAGAIAIDVKQLGVDAYAVPGQKWLCGPEGTGALYVSRDRSAEILPSHVSGGAWANCDLQGNFTLREDASRFDTPGHLYEPAIAGLKESLRWFLDDVGPDWAYDRTVENAARCRQILESIEGVEILTPPGRHAGLLHFTVAGWDPAAVFEELLRRDVLIRNVLAPACLRVSTGFYNNEDDLQALAAGVKELLAQQPHPPSLV